MVSRLFASDQFVEADAEHSGNELEEREAFAFALLAKIGCERLCPLGRLVSAPVIFVAKGRGEAFLRFAAGHLGREWFARDNRRKHATFRPRPLEAFDLLAR